MTDMLIRNQGHLVYRAIMSISHSGGQGINQYKHGASGPDRPCDTKFLTACDTLLYCIAHAPGIEQNDASR